MCHLWVNYGYIILWYFSSSICITYVPPMCELWVYYGTSARAVLCATRGILCIATLVYGTKGILARPVRVPPMGELWVYYIYSGICVTYGSTTGYTMYTLVLRVLEQGHYCVPPLGELRVYTTYVYSGT